jgi:hypothetical protein
MTVTPPSSGIQTSFITFTSAASMTIGWQTTDNSQAGIYTVQITGTITAASIWTKSTTFTLTVVASCLYSTETILITGSTVIA